MTRRSFLAASLMAPPVFAQKRAPNILFVTADDLGLYLGCYGEKRIATPNLDRFAAENVRFETAYVAQASCSPSRSAMFTGLFPHFNGQYGLANGGFKLHEELRGATIPNLLKKSGYRTGIIGKLHVEPEDSFLWDYRQKGNETRRVRTVAPQAEAFMKQDGPFFLMVNFGDPHAFATNDNPRKWYFPPDVEGIPEKPLAASRETLFDWQQVDNPAQRERTANYLNAVARFDTGVGLLLAALEKTGKAADTLVIIIGDHGAPFARGKTTVYESGLRVPFLVRWPGVSKAHVSGKMVSTVDILPTILDAAGAAPPHKLHGMSLRPILSGSNTKWREFLAAEFHFHGATPFFPRRAIRDGRFKLIHNLLAGKAKPGTGIDGDTAYPKSATDAPLDARQAFQTFGNPPEFELYDLQTDPVEFHNLAGKPEHHAATERLKKALLAWRKETADPALDGAFLEKMANRRPPPA